MKKMGSESSPNSDQQLNKESSHQVINTDPENQSPLSPRAKYGNHRNKTTFGFERAHWQKALKQKERESNMYYRNEKIDSSVPVEHFKAYGPGIYLFFLFVKTSITLFTIMSIVQIIPLVYNVINGDGYKDAVSTFQIYIAKLTIGNQVASKNSTENIKDHIFNTIPDIICTAIFFLFYFYWMQRSKKQSKSLKLDYKLASDLTIQLVKFPKDISEREVEEYFSKYGPVKEVAAVKNYEKMIELSSDIYSRSLKIKEKTITAAVADPPLNGKQKQKFEEDIQKREKKINDLIGKLEEVESERELKVIKFYVSFYEEEAKNNVLKDYQPHEKMLRCFCSKDSFPDNLKIKGKMTSVKECRAEPGGIIWENMHITWKSRWIRFILQGMLLVALIAGGFLFIAFLNICSASFTASASQSSAHYNFSQIQKQTFEPLIQSWCVSKKTLNPQQLKFCQPYLQQYLLKILLTIAISVSILIVKFILKTVVIRIARFQRYKDHTELSTNIMTNLLLTYIFTTVLITFLLQANIFGVSFKNGVSIFIQDQKLKNNLSNLAEYRDFTRDWYVDIGYQIWLNWLILAFMPHFFMPIYHWAMEKYGMWKGKKQVLQKNVMEYIQAEEFQIEDHYANVLMIIFVGFCFSGGIPCMLFLSLIGLLSRYFYFKYIFIRYSRIPKTYTEAMNQRVIALLPFMLIIHILFSLWMYGVVDILTDSSTIFSSASIEQSEYSSEIQRNLMTFVKKMRSTWYISATLLLYIIILLFKKLIFNTLKKFCCRGAPSEKHEENNVDLKGTSIMLTESYKIEKNPNYMPIMAIMKPSEAHGFLKSTVQGQAYFHDCISE